MVNFESSHGEIHSSSKDYLRKGEASGETAVLQLLSCFEYIAQNISIVRKCIKCTKVEAIRVGNAQDPRRKFHDAATAAKVIRKW